MPSLKQVASMSFLYCSMAWLTRSLAPPAAEGASCLIVTGCRGGGLFWNIGGGGGASIGLCCSKTCLNSGWVMADTENMTFLYIVFVTKRTDLSKHQDKLNLKSYLFLPAGGGSCWVIGKGGATTLVMVAMETTGGGGVWCWVWAEAPGGGGGQLTGVTIRDEGMFSWVISCSSFTFCWTWWDNKSIINIVFWV